MKKSALAAGLSAAAGKQVSVAAEVPPILRKGTKAASKTVLVGAHYPPEVRRTLLLVRAERENEGKNLKALLGEAINDLCAKYGKPQPYTEEA